MSDTSMIPWAWRVKTGILLICVLFLWGCVSGQQQVNSTVQPEHKLMERSLISIASMPEQTGVHLVGNEKPVYTAIRQSVPRGVVLYFPQTVIGDGVKDLVLQSGPITFVSARPVAQNSGTVKVEILVNRDFQYEVFEAGKELQVLFSFERPTLQTVSDDGMPGAPAGGDEGLVMGKDPQGNTVIFTQETLPTDFSGTATSMSGTPADEKAGLTASPLNVPMVSAEKSALMDIRFTATETGYSTLILETGRPVEYDIKRNGDNEITLFLKNTTIPAHHQRPLITTYFNSAVERVLPVQAGGDEKDSHISIHLRHKTPYRILQEANRLTLVFDPAPVMVPEFKQARVVLNPDMPKRVSGDDGSSLSEMQFKKQETNGLISDPLPLSAGITNPEEDSSALDSAAYAKKQPTYTGEKISLDFYETDIKNVFRILRTISGENFAIDKDVTGNVTLALDQPVPWDQVLDLVLKMNALGKVREGNIIRIATQNTLKKEFEGEQKTLAARQQAMAKKEELKPLVTSYLPINYSSAETDIKPHLEKLLTPKRGQLSVDSRTNMIILTDVQDKIDQAKVLINRLDTVTPQIMIAARVVEVSKNFSRELGIAWGASSQDVYRSDLGGTYGFDVAMNYPAASDSSLSYTFNRIVGTPFSINATLTAAEAKGDVKIVSSPRILTLDNKKATITQGLEYPYQTVDKDGQVETEFKDIDLKLEVTPHVTPDHRISMQVFIEKNDITDFAVTGEPVISSNEATTDLLVNDGNTIVIGGVVKRTTTEGREGFPFLSGIPILGHLFRSDSKMDNKNELLIFLTPTIVQLEQKIQE